MTEGMAEAILIHIFPLESPKQLPIAKIYLFIPYSYVIS